MTHLELADQLVDDRNNWVRKKRLELMATPSETVQQRVSRVKEEMAREKLESKIAEENIRKDYTLVMDPRPYQEMEEGDDETEEDENIE